MYVIFTFVLKIKKIKRKNEEKQERIEDLWQKKKDRKEGWNPSLDDGT